MKLIVRIFAIAAVNIVLLSCRSPQQGNIQGTVTPASSDVRVVVRNGTAVVGTRSPNVQTGRFSIAVAPGSYDVAVLSTSSPFPVTFPGIVVKPGGTTALGTIQIAQAHGTGNISGRIRTARTAARVALLMDGRERAAVLTDSSGRYELKELPAGAYTLQAQATDYAPDSRTVGLTEGQKAAVNIRLLYQTTIDGVDWTRGTVRARGVGSPPLQQTNPTVRREMAKRAALVDAERNLLGLLEMMEIGPGERLSKALGERTYTQTIEGYVRGYHTVAERDLDGGRIEVEIELPLTGPGGLTSLLSAE